MLRYKNIKSSLIWFKVLLPWQFTGLTATYEEACPLFNCPDHSTRVLWEKFDKLLNLFKGFALAASGHIPISLICLICKE